MTTQPWGQLHHRDQPGTRHTIVVIDHRRLCGKPLRNLHSKCLTEQDRVSRENINHPSSEAAFLIPIPEAAPHDHRIPADI